MLRDEGTMIDDIYYCPHLVEGIIERYKVDCNCRKPKTGMFLDAAKQHNIDLTQSLMIGDSEVDMLAGKNAGCTCVFIKGVCNNDSDISPIGTDYIVKDLLEAARLFTKHDDILFGDYKRFDTKSHKL